MNWMQSKKRRRMREWENGATENEKIYTFTAYSFSVLKWTLIYQHRNVSRWSYFYSSLVEARNRVILLFMNENEIKN